MYTDSRGRPTVEVECFVDGSLMSRAASSGASTGSHEAVELRDGVIYGMVQVSKRP